MSGTAAPTPRELGRFLEIQNLGLNLPFALAFLLVAANGWPPWWPTLLALLAFLGARNAGHAFNRWIDREQDRANPRTRARALVTGRISGRFALLLVAANAALLLVAAYLLNPLALLLAPVALALVLGYSVTKKLGWGTTLFLGLVESVTAAGAFVAIEGALPVAAGAAIVGMFAWGTAFEIVHSLRDLDSDRALGLPSIPARFGPQVSRALIPAFHAIALGGFALLGVLDHLRSPYALGLVGMAGFVAYADSAGTPDSESLQRAFRRHMALGSVFLLATVLALFAPGIPGWTL